MDSKINVMKEIVNCIKNEKMEEGSSVIKNYYPFDFVQTEKRKYSEKQKMEIFLKDHFIDRYSGDKLLNPGILKVISTYYPKEFPYQSHWKMTECHVAYWELIPTLDHIVLVALGGVNNSSNWATTSMLHNKIKDNWRLEDLGWTLYDIPIEEEWDDKRIH